MPFTLRLFRRVPVQFAVRYHASPFLTLPLAYIVGFGALITLLMLNTGPASAEWLAIGSSDSLGGYTVYVDPDTIRRNGDLVKVWALTDYTTLQTVADRSFLSSKAQNEFDCTEERERELAVTWLSGKMGKGDGVWTNSEETPWRPVAPGSVGQGVWDFACACAIIPCRTPPVTEPRVRHEWRPPHTRHHVPRRSDRLQYVGDRRDCGSVGTEGLVHEARPLRHHLLAVTNALYLRGRSEVYETQ